MKRAIFVALVGAVALGAFYAAKYWPRSAPPAPVPTVKPATAPVPPQPTDAGPRQPAIAHPVAAEAGPRHPLPALDQSDGYIGKALVDLLGRKPVASFLNLDGFARRFVATVNNLGGESAAPELWPVRPTPGRFEADKRGDRLVIGARNADRYEPFVRFVEGIDSRQAVAAYVRLYPLFQRAYEDLGEPGRYFNDRLIAVIDELLAAPDLPEPVPVKMIGGDGGSPPASSTHLYLFEDPSLENRAAGQKILVRIGRENAKRLKAKLTEVRALLVAQPAR
jgi:hypothetical protein